MKYLTVMKTAISFFSAVQSLTLRLARNKKSKTVFLASFCAHVVFFTSHIADAVFVALINHTGPIETQPCSLLSDHGVSSSRALRIAAPVIRFAALAAPRETLASRRSP